MPTVAVRLRVAPPTARVETPARLLPARFPILARRGAATTQAPLATPLATTLAEVVAQRSLLQRNVSKDTTSGRWVGDDKRPGWQVAAERSMVAGYNLLHGTSVTKVDYTAEQLDRCHKLSFKDIQDNLLVYLNTSDDSGYTKWLLLMVCDLPEGDKVTKVAGQLMDDVRGGEPDDVIAKQANKLLGMLNSLTDNLRAADKTLNSYIKEHLDPHGGHSPGGTWHPSQGTRRATAVATSDPLLTPEHRSRMVTSEGPVALGSISPHYQRQLQGRDWDTMGAKSTNVLNKLYPGQGIKKSTGTGKYTHDFKVRPARTNIAELYEEYRTLSRKKKRSPAQEDRFQKLTGIMRRMRFI